MRSLRFVLIFSLVITSIAGLGPGNKAGHCAFIYADDSTSNPASYWGVDLSDRDPSVKPGDDFFMSQNGGWFARTELTPQIPQAAYWRDLRLSPQRLNEILLNGPVRNLDAWYKAFDVRPGDRLYLAPTNRVRIW